MCRIIAGTLVQVGCGLMPLDQIAAVLESHDRQLAGPTMPAAGLSLHHVEVAKIPVAGLLSLGRWTGRGVWRPQLKPTNTGLISSGHSPR